MLRDIVRSFYDDDEPEKAVELHACDTCCDYTVHDEFGDCRLCDADRRKAERPRRLATKAEIYGEVGLTPGVRPKTTKNYKPTPIPKKKAMHPELVMKQHDDGSWIINRTFGEDVQTWTFTSQEDASAMIAKMRELYEGMGAPADLSDADEQTEDRNYDQGYEDGYNGRQNSLLYSSSPAYQQGWADGDGDRLYGVERDDAHA